MVTTCGYFLTYLNNLKLARRNDRLTRVNRRLSDFYGPLLALISSREASWNAFGARYGPQGSFWMDTPVPAREEAEAWRLWMTPQFMPVNKSMMELVFKHADPIDRRMVRVERASQRTGLGEDGIGGPRHRSISRYRGRARFWRLS